MPRALGGGARSGEPAPVPDVLAPGLRVLFCGINPSLRSSLAGHHFASPGNPFWRLLHAAGLTPVLLRPDEDRRLVEWGLGLTNGCARPSRAAAELSRAELAEGARQVRATVERLRPQTVALVGVSLYRVFFPRGREPGPGPKRARLAGARVFVLPNPSGLNQAFPGFEHKLLWFRALAAHAPTRSRDRRRPGPAAQRGSRPAPAGRERRPARGRKRGRGAP